MAHAQNLPVEVLERIFSYLAGFQDRKSAGLTCSRWYSVFSSPRHRHNYAVRFESDEDFTAFQLSNTSNIPYYHFQFRQVEINKSSLAFWHQHGPCIKTLTLTRCPVDQIFAEVLSLCVQLESLNVTDCKDLFMSGIFLDGFKTQLRQGGRLMKMKSIDLSYNSYVSDAIIEHVVAVCPQIMELNLTGCHVSYNNAIYHKFYPHVEYPASDSVTTFPTIMRALQKKNNTCLTLNVSETFLDNVSLVKLAMSGQHHVLGLGLRACTQLADQGIIDMCASNMLHASLTELHLDQCNRLTDAAFTSVCCSLHSLTHLSVQGCVNITDSALNNLAQLHKLHTFKAGKCTTLYGHGLVMGLANRKNLILNEISLREMENLSEEMFIKLVENLPQLRVMDVSGCRKAITDASLQIIFKHNRLLRSLNISMCVAITDTGLTGRGISNMKTPPEKQMRIPLGSRHELEIRKDAEIQEEAKERSQLADPVGHETQCVAQLRGLRILHLSGCERITDFSLEHGFFFKELQQLDLTECQLITHVGLKFLSENCKSVENLNLTWCHKISDEAVSKVVDGLARLRVLTLGNSILSGGIARIVEKSQLAELDVRHCTNISPDSVRHLKQTVPSLRILKYRETLTSTQLEPQVIPPNPPKYKLWSWCSRPT